MGDFVKIAATIGGAAATGGASLGASLGSMSLLQGASLGFSVFSTTMQGQQETKQYEAQAATEKFNATTREIERKKNLIRSLALTNVRMGAGGIGTGGSAQNLAFEDIHAADLDQSIDNTGTRVKIDTAKSNARTAQFSSLLSAGSDVTSTLLRTSRRGKV